MDICAYAVMSNHYHLILRVDAESATAWTQREVIDRWTKLFSMPVLVERYLRGQTTTDAEVNKVVEIIEEWRQRLTDISWFMRVLNESIARQANREDHCTGRFWEGRFKSQALLDDAAILACMAYVDSRPARWTGSSSSADRWGATGFRVSVPVDGSIRKPAQREDRHRSGIAVVPEWD